MCAARLQKVWGLGCEGLQCLGFRVSIGFLVGWQSPRHGITMRYDRAQKPEPRALKILRKLFKKASTLNPPKTSFTSREVEHGIRVKVFKGAKGWGVGFRTWPLPLIALAESPCWHQFGP